MTEQIVLDIPENPVPEGTHAATFQTPDGMTLRYSITETDRESKGTVILLHGRNESIEKYFETIRDLTDRGFVAATFDWRGQGGSQRLLADKAKGHVKNFGQYVTDLDTFFKSIILPDCKGPFYILAHSTGGLVALLASPLLVNRIKRMVLVAPLLELTNQPLTPGQIRVVSRAMCLLGMGTVYMGGGPKPPEEKPFANNKLTSDPERYARNAAIVAANPSLALGSPTARWVRSAVQAMRKVTTPEYMESLRIPMLFVAAGSDQIVSTPAVELYASHTRCGGLVTVDGARHELLQEADFFREQFWAAFDAFIPGTQAPAISTEAA